MVQAMGRRTASGAVQSIALARVRASTSMWSYPTPVKSTATSWSLPTKERSLQRDPAEMTASQPRTCSGAISALRSANIRYWISGISSNSSSPGPGKSKFPSASKKSRVIPTVTLVVICILSVHGKSLHRAVAEQVVFAVAEATHQLDAGPALVAGTPRGLRG